MNQHGAIQPISLHELPPTVLRALARMTPPLRDAWIDQYVLGKRLNSYGRDCASEACKFLRGWFGSADELREAA